jgi:hypothetical protein
MQQTRVQAANPSRSTQQIDAILTEVDDDRERAFSSHCALPRVTLFTAQAAKLTL